MNSNLALGRDECLNCGSFDLDCSLQAQKFTYGAEGDEVELEALVPVWTCEACGEQYTDGTGEERRHEAVCRHLGRLTPAEIVGVRQKYRMTQDELATVTGLGVASIKRWESGNQIQSESSDKFLRLVALPTNVAFLGIVSAGQSALRSPKFQTPLSAVSLTESARFQLRRMPAGGV